MESLDGVTVADLTRQLPGPFASRELLRLGARVVKIEPPGGDPTPEPWYGELNRGKAVITWNARAEPPPAVLREADVVLEGFRPGVFERLGVELSETTVLCSITGFGAAGAHAAEAGHDLNYLAYAGVLADTAPAMPPAQIADLAGGALHAVVEILAALLERTRTGRGAHVVVSMAHNAHRLVAHRLAGDPVPRLLTGGVACYRLYETADGRHLSVAALEPKFWRNLCDLLERPDLADRAYEPELPELAALFRTRTLDEWRELLEGRDTCVAPVLSIGEAAAELSR
jgi:crotonobetainyl-CoA:carnitine CoA-transferase CaiB-like acyl-CoA transferase